MCNTITGETWTHIYSSQIGTWQQTTVRIPPKPNLVNQWILWRLITGVWGRGYLEKHKLLKKKKLKVHSIKGDSSQNLETRSALHSLQPTGQVEDCLSQASQAVLVFSILVSWYLMLEGSVVAPSLFSSSAYLTVSKKVFLLIYVWGAGV